MSADENRANSRTSNFGFDYFNIAFVSSKRYCFALGLRPYSKVSYNTESISEITGSESSVKESYFGEGGINAINFTNGFVIQKDSVSNSILSAGVDASLLIGKISKNNATNEIYDDGTESDDQVNVRESNTYRGFQFKLGLSYRKELFKGKAWEMLPACQPDSNGLRPLKEYKVDKYFYSEEIEKTADTAYVSDYAVIFPGNSVIKISKKIKSGARRDQLINYYAGFVKKGFGVLVLETAIGLDYTVLKENYLAAIDSIKSGHISKEGIDLVKVSHEYLRKHAGVFLNTGLVYELGSNLNVTGTTELVRTNTTSNTDYSVEVISSYEDNEFALPQTVHFGFSIDKPNVLGRDYCGNKLASTWAIGADVSFTNWTSFEGLENPLNTYRFALGGEFTPDPSLYKAKDKNGLVRLVNKTSYRTGVYYKTLPFEVNGSQIAELGINFGLTFPANNSGGSMTWNFGYARRGVDLVENYFNIGLGLTLNESRKSTAWFNRRKVGL